MAESTLRIAVVLAPGALRRWQADCLRHLMAVPGVRVEGVVEVPAAPEKCGYLYRRWLLRASRSGMLATEGIPAELAGTRRMAGLEAAREALRQGTFDVLLQLGGEELPAVADAQLAHGHWCFTLDQAYSPDPVPGLPELLQGERTIGAALQRRQGPQPASALQAGCFPLHGHGAEATADAVLAAWAHWPARASRAIIAGLALNAAPEPARAARSRSPGNGAMLRLRLRQLLHRSPGLKAPSGEWNIGVLPHPAASLLGEAPNRNVRWLPAPAAGNARATPFGWMQEERLNVLYMKAGQAPDPPVIARLRPKKDNNLKRSRTVLEAEGPLSYPCIVEQGGAYFAVPEQCASGRVDLYRINAEATELAFVQTLLHAPLHSPTLFRHGEHWWLMGTGMDLPDAQLLAFHARQLEGPYLPHPLNPLKEDVRSARPGGTPFLADGVLRRPAQDLGGAVPRVRINRVLELTPDRFEEEAGDPLEPFKGAWGQGMRTLCPVGAITLVDGLRATQGKKAGGDRKR